MTDDSPAPLQPGSPESIELMNEFIHAYGTALAAWAQLEDSMAELFHRLIRTTPSMARALFFSGRSFATRADLFSAAIATTSMDSRLRDALKTILKRSRQYSGTRNSIAHGIPVRLFGGGPYQGIRLKQGDQVWSHGGVSGEQMIQATTNFQKLQTVIQTLAWTKHDDFPLIEQLHPLVLELPSEAFPREAIESPPTGE